MSRSAITKTTAIILAVIIIVVAVGIGVGLYLVTRPGPKPTIKLGCHEPLTGALAKHGEGSLRGIKLAVKHFEEDTGYDVELIVRDDESSPERAAEVVEELCTMEKVIAITGGYGSHIIGAASEAAERNKVIYITSGGVASELVERGFKYFFRCTNVPGYAKAQIGFCKEKGVKKLAIIYNTKVATTDLAGHAKALAEEEGIEVVYYEGYPAGTADFKPMITAAVAAGAEVLIQEGYFPDYVACIRDCQTLDAPFKAWIGCWGAMIRDFIDELGDLSEYCYGTSYWVPGAVPPELKDLETRFIEDFRKEFGGDPDYLAIIGYSHTWVLLQAIKRVLDAGKPLTSDNIREELLKTDTITLMGPVKFDERGENIKAEVLLCQIQEGEFVAVWPSERKTGDAIYPAVPWRPPAASSILHHTGTACLHTALSAFTLTLNAVATWPCRAHGCWSWWLERCSPVSR